jgi:hypothetical protein
LSSTVLIITNELDEHADAVIRELHRRSVPVFRFHPEDYPHACSVSIEVRDGRITGDIVNAYRRVALDDICAAWYRRSRSLLAGSIAPTSTKLDDYVKAQSLATLTALYESLQTLWVGHPHALRRADIKALQLAAASKAGLQTPHTLISNDPSRAAAFAGLQSTSNRECAIKPLMAIGVSDGRGYRLPLTTTLPRDQSLDTVALAPTIFQPYVEKAAELRCVVIGERVFCARINSQSDESTRKDWRAGDCEHEVFTLPESVEASIQRLMGSFGINFASLDMILTPDGEYVFLELNPNGQWLWLEEELGFPLVASMADLLTSDRSREETPDEAGRERCHVGVYA